MRNHPSLPLAGLVFPALALLLFTCRAPAAAPNESEAAETAVIDAKARNRLDSTLNALIGEGGVAGISALIFEDGKEAYFRAEGRADRTREIPMARNTIVQIYSMTKPLTGTALMQLVEGGKLDLDDPVAKYIPELAELEVYAGTHANGTLLTEPQQRQMTVRDLTRHTAGFYHGGDHPVLQPLWEAANPRARDHTLAEMAEKLASYPLLFQPGEQWLYGPSVDMQALIVERVSGQPFDEYLHKHVLSPLGMDKTRYFVPEADRNRLSAVYQRDANGDLNQMAADEALAFNTNEQVFTPGGWGLTSTLDDYMTFARMLLNKGSLKGVKVLQPETVRLMATNQLDESITERSWLPSKGQVGFGINFAVRLRPPATAQENNGAVGEYFWDGAASTLFWVDPINKLAAVVFLQLFPYDPVGVHKKIRDAVYGKAYIAENQL